MQSLIVSFITKPDCDQAFVDEILKLQRSTMDEPCAINYELLRGAPGTHTFYLYERYADASAMKTHLASPYLTAAGAKFSQLLAQPHTLIACDFLSGLQPRRITIGEKQVAVHIIPLGPANLVFAQTEHGILACGAIDPSALQRFDLPTARVKPTRGPSISNLDDLLAGEVREANTAATAVGIKVGMSGRDALMLL
jgi:quinol monooxygenase YgiN/uncharacterized protein YunC (DUF1805 family)